MCQRSNDKTQDNTFLLIYLSCVKTKQKGKAGYALICKLNKVGDEIHMKMSAFEDVIERKCIGIAVKWKAH